MNISFRVWDEITRSYSGGDLWSINASGKLYYGNARWTDGIVELFTGIKDIKKSKIFEGDIVKRGYDNMNGSFYNDYPIIYSVSDGAFMCGENKRLTKNMIKSWNIEVIGNIHEGIKI